MDTAIYNPLEEYEKKLKPLHFENTKKLFEKLTKESGVDVDANKETVKQYNIYTERLSDVKKKLRWRKFFRVLMWISVLLIPVAILKLNPQIKELKDEVNFADQKASEFLTLANEQMKPLIALFKEWDSITLIEETMPLLKFMPQFTVEQESNMKINYDFHSDTDVEQSTLDVLSGEYNENPFVFENRLVHRMGTETYYGYKTISWTETYRDSDGKMQTRRRTERLQASVTKPKPFYHTEVVLNYGAQAAPDLCFFRDATNLHNKSEKAIERYIKRGEKRLDRKASRALKKGDDFTSMANSDFEVLFDALDRTDEVQFRTLFTPLAQTNMVDLILSKTGYGDDFNFMKTKRMNTISSVHSQNRNLVLPTYSFTSHSFEIIEQNFLLQNAEYFKAIYFDLAPVLAIPAYQERPVHSLKPIPDYSQLYSLKESETLANLVNEKDIVHPDTKTEAILKSSYISTENGVDKTTVTAYSYDIEKRVDIVSVRGGDGHWHNVSVPWDEYIPLEHITNFGVTQTNKAVSALATKNGLCIFKL